MARISVFLTDEVVSSATEGLKKLGKSGLVARKLQAIIAAKKYGITKTAEFYSITKKTLIQWIKDLKQEITLKPLKFSLEEVENHLLQKLKRLKLRSGFLRIAILQSINYVR
jgi:hypothetical protein